MTLFASHVVVEFDQPVSVYCSAEQSWRETTSVAVAPEEVTQSGCLLIIQWDTNLLAVPLKAVTSMATHLTRAYDMVTANGCLLQVKSLAYGLEAARHIEALGDLSQMLQDAAPYDAPVGVFLA